MSVVIPERELINVSDLKVDGENPNRMTDKQLARLESSITRYGFIVPIITNKDLLVADGEQRLTVAQKLHMTQVPVVRLPVEDVDRRLLRQVLNKLRGEHELVADALEFQRIIEAGHEQDLKHLIDLSDSQLERYLSEIREPKPEDYEIPEIDKIKTGIQRGEIYHLGEHRLMCGDATSREDVEALMNGHKAELLFSSPPYLDERRYGGHGNATENLSNFIITFFPFTEYICLNLGLVKRNYEIYEYWQTYIQKAKAVGYKFLSWNVWNREKAGHVAQQTAMFALYHEWIFVFGKQPRKLNRTIRTRYNEHSPKDHRKIRAVSRNKTTDAVEFTTTPTYKFKQLGTVTTMSYDNKSDMRQLHPAIFPIDLPKQYIEAMTTNPDNIIDCFGGSGSTLIACEQTGRRCYMMEIDPRYCQVIVDRWQAYTGNKAIKAD